jgi:hypothetical protein
MRFAAEKGAEETARFALENEDLGKLDTASERWNDMLRYKEDADPEQRAWGLVAEKHLKELRDVDWLDGELQKGKDKKEGKSSSETMALKALAEEADGKIAVARDTWGQLKRDSESDPEQRRWYLLAAKKVRELKNKEEDRK